MEVRTVLQIIKLYTWKILSNYLLKEVFNANVESILNLKDADYNIKQRNLLHLFFYFKCNLNFNLSNTRVCSLYIVSRNKPIKL